MNISTITKWWPVTHDYGLIRSDVRTVAATRRLMFERENMSLEVVDLVGDLEDCFGRLEPLSPAPVKEMYLATNFGWTAFFQNGIQGSDPFLSMSQLSRQLDVTAMRVCATPSKARYQAVIWEVYDGPERGGDGWGHRRSIAAVNDGGRWVFHQSGTPFEFESPDAYQASAIRRRFTSEMLLRYLKALEIPPLSDSVLAVDHDSGNAMLARPLHDHLPSFTLDEVLANTDGSTARSS